nr:MAG TPA: hypothetical protein [Caudoviricetes sp.]
MLSLASYNYSARMWQEADKAQIQGLCYTLYR